MNINSIFKEYDIRGIVDKELNSDVVKLIGYFLGQRISKISNKPKVSIAYDVRHHSIKMLEYLSSGLNASNIEVHNMSLSATPVNYFSNYAKTDTQNIIFDATIMITASHNPKEYNGFKITLNKKPFFGEDIQDLKHDVIQALNNKTVIKDNTYNKPIDINSIYINFMVDNFKHLKNLNQKILFDSGNGSVGFLMQEIATRLNLDFVHLFKEPDGSFPNHHPDPSKKENLQDINKAIKDFDIAFAYDGDGDRIAVITNQNEIKGDILAIIFAKQMKNPILIGEVKCSRIMYQEVNKIGKAIMHKTGHSNIKEKIQQENASFGAEVSGHLFFNDKYFGYDDAIYNTFRVLELIYNGINLDKEIEKLPKVFSTDEINIKVKEENKFSIIQNISDEIKNNGIKDFVKINETIDIDGLRLELDDGFVLVRASNTSPYLVTRFESTSKDNLDLYQKIMTKLIHRFI